MDGSDDPYSPEIPESPENFDGIETLDGMQDFNALEGEGLNGAMSVKVSPDNRFVYVTGILSDSVAVFERNLTNGVLTQVQALYNGGSFALDGAREIGLSPDGASVLAGRRNGIGTPFESVSCRMPAKVSNRPMSGSAGQGS